MKPPGRRRAIVASTYAFFLTACGGGGGGGASSPVGSPSPTPPAPSPPQPLVAPAVTLTYGIKQLRFSWPAVAGASHYQLLERANVGEAFVQLGNDFTGTSVNHNVALHRRANAVYRIQACNSSGCTSSNDIALAANLLPAIGYFKASNAEAGDQFGLAVALSGDGNTLAVGAAGEASDATGVNGNQTSNAAFEAGAVYVFTRAADGSWSQQAYVKASNTGVQDRFGFLAIALSTDGNTMAVGSNFEASGATGVNGNQLDNSAPNAGAVYAFVRTNGVWAQQAYLKASNTESQDTFGWSIALSGDGNTLAVGALGESSNAIGINGNQSSNAAQRSGAVYVFSRMSGVWFQQAYVKASNTGTFDEFGGAVALNSDGNTLAVGAQLEPSSATGINGNQLDNSAQAGAVYIFTRSVTTWAQQAYIKASNTDQADAFGFDLALSADGNTLAASAPVEGSISEGINGDQVNNLAFGSGAVYIFVRSAGIWSQQAYVKASNTGQSDGFGSSVSISADGNTLVIGAEGEDSDGRGVNGNQTNDSANQAGAVYVFSRSGATWSQLAFVKAPNSESPDHFGRKVSLSADGSTLAIGAYFESSNAIGVGGNQSDNSASIAGAAYLY